MRISIQVIRHRYQGGASFDSHADRLAAHRSILQVLSIKVIALSLNMTNDHPKRATRCRPLLRRIVCELQLPFLARAARTTTGTGAGAVAAKKGVTAE